jgi:alpha-ketoglutarate-dependent taurine dioxygenase
MFSPIVDEEGADG